MMVGLRYGRDGDCSLDGVNGKSGSCWGIREMVGSWDIINGMVGSSFVPWDIST